MPVRLVHPLNRAHDPTVQPLLVANPPINDEWEIGTTDPGATWSALVLLDPPRDTSTADRTMPGLAGVELTMRRLRAGQWAFHQGTPSMNVCVVYSGSFTDFAATKPTGATKFVESAFPGDLMGLGCLGSGVHACTATALEDGTICSMPRRHRQLSVPAVRDREPRVLGSSTRRECWTWTSVTSSSV